MNLRLSRYTRIRSVGSLFVLGAIVTLAVIATPVSIQPGTADVVSLSTAHADTYAHALCRNDDSTLSQPHPCTFADDISPACREDPQQCTTDDTVNLHRIAGCSPDRPWQIFALTVSSGDFTDADCTPIQVAEAAQAIEKLSTIPGQGNSCGRIWDWFGFTCIFRAFSVFITTALISITAWLLTVSGLLFDLVVDKTILQFGSLYNEQLKAGVEAGWTALRDISNILIIGIFVFIAISLILGIKEYGERKMIARVLIIAVLINFSLLFTKMIIDGSNFVARQLYAASAFEPIDPKEGAGVTIPPGIAGRFIIYMGVTSAGHTYDIAEGKAYGVAGDNYASASAWTTLLHGMFAATLFIAAAFVLLYGSFLLLTRALLFIFLMLTAALAFASYLTPTFEQQGWKTWWDSLLRNAILAPLLIALLEVSLLVGEKVKEKGGAGEGGVLGALIADPTGDFDMGVLFSYLVIIGMLFMSFRLASSFSKSIAGFSSVRGLTIGAAAVASLPFLATSRLAGLTLRTGVGGLAERSAAARAKAIEKRVNDKDKPGKGPNWRERAIMTTQRWTGRRTFDIANTGPAKKLAKAGGVMMFGEKWGEKGIIGTRERQAAAALKAARDLGYKSETETRKVAEKKARDEQAGERAEQDSRKAEHERNKGNPEFAREPVETATKTKLNSDRSSKENEETKNQTQAKLAVVRNEAKTAAGKGELTAVARTAVLEAAKAAAAHSTSDEMERTIGALEKEKLQVELELQEQRTAQAASAADEAQKKTVTEDLNKIIQKSEVLDAEIMGTKEVLGEFNKAVTEAGNEAVRNAAKAANAGLRDVAADRKVSEDKVTARGDHAVREISDIAIGKKMSLTRPGRLWGLFGNPETDPVAKSIQGAVRKSAERDVVTRMVEVARETGQSLNVNGGTATGGTTGSTDQGGGQSTGGTKP